MRDGARPLPMRIGYPAIRPLDGNAMDPDRVERIFRAAQLYFEARKLAGKFCGTCQRQVPLSADAGGPCPHCSGRWSGVVRRAWDMALQPEDRGSLCEKWDRLTQTDVAAQMSTPQRGVSRSEVQRLLGEAEQFGLVRHVVLGSPADHTLQETARRLAASLGLAAVALVPGRPETLLPGGGDDPYLNATREAVRLAAAQAAANEIDARLQEGDTLCLAWGRMVYTISKLLRPSHHLPGLNVVPMVGVLSQKPSVFTFEANALAEAAAASYGSTNAYWLPAPAIVRARTDKDATLRNPVVNDVMKRIRCSTFVVTSLAAPDPAESAMVHCELLIPEDVERVRKRGAVGEISGLWFDANGNAVPDEAIEPIGMDIEGLKRVVRGGGIVMAVIAAHPTRIRALLAAIRGGIVNAVVTDGCSAQALLALSAAEPAGA
ncbi:MAG: hypothetical protein IT208_02230 [Chthonomonadales bacterium]|nr:hypothetical protein [Chthonomonadales bacterium]